jgi:molecular chaperone Hsp33
VELILSTPTGAVVADSQPSGYTRGLIEYRESASSVAMGDGAQLKVVRRMHQGEPHQSVISTGRGDSVSDALMAYMQTSEQIFSVIVTQSLLSDAGVVASGGFIVQLLPECGRGPLMLMTERLKEFQDLGSWLQDTGADPELLMSEILYGLEHTILKEDAIVFGCEGGESRALAAVVSLGATEINALIGKGEDVEVDCHYCKRRFAFTADRLRKLIVHED